MSFLCHVKKLTIMLYKRILPFIIALLAFPLFTVAQVTTSTLTGSTRDAEGQPLVGATVSATHLPTGTKYTTVSRAGGNFTISNMRPGGPYQVQISYVGNKTETYDEIYLKLAEATELTSTLQKSSTALEGVVITSTGGRNSIINAKRTGAVTNINRTSIERMPSISRNINDLARATPQANGSSIGGGNFRQNFVTVDGSDFNNSFGIGSNLPAGGAPISVDALEEISVSITPFDIRQSGFIGSATNAITRSGTNNFSGSVYTYFRTEKQQGDKVNKVEFVRNPFSFKQYGARVGFPIIPNKLFAFFNYETENQPKQVQTRFAATASNPFTGTGNVARPTADSLNFLSKFLRDKYGYETGPFDGYSTAIAREKFLARIDWNINAKNRLNVRYSRVVGGEPNPPSSSRNPFTAGYATGAGRTDINALYYKNSIYFQGANFESLAAELNSVFGGKIANTFRATYTFQDDSRTSPSAPFPYVDILSFDKPYTTFGYEAFSFLNLRKVKLYSFVDNLTWTLNKHQLTAGIQTEFSRTINGFNPFGYSYYTYATLKDFLDGNKPQDLGLTYSLTPGFPEVFSSFKFAQNSLYAQDEISASKNFRLTLGLRVDQPKFPGVEQIIDNPLVSSLTFAKGEKINTGNLPAKRLMLSPRLGFNWDVMGDRSLQVRGGTGIFTGRIPFVWIVSQSGTNGMIQFTQTYVGQANTPGPFNPDPFAYRPATPPPAGTQIPSTITELVPNFKFPQTWKTSLAFDKKLGSGLILTLEGIFNKDIHTAIFRNPNLVAPAPLNVSGYADNRLFYPVANKDKFINPLTSGVFNATTNPKPNSPVPNGDARGTQQFNPIVIDNGSKGYYASITAKLEKQFSKGFFGTLAYTGTLADNVFDGGGDQPLSAYTTTPTVNGAEFLTQGNANYVLPNRVIAGLSYRIEYLKHLATTVSLFYEGAIERRFSYTYTSDFNRDGVNSDLIYIPTDARDPNQINFSSNTIKTNINGVAGTRTFTPAEQAQMFNDYIDQDKYLSKHRGEYAERNAANTPWRNQIDVKLLQDLFVNVGKKRNTIQLSLDIFNFGNLLNSRWGIYKTVNAPSILVPTAPGSGAIPVVGSANSLVVGGTIKPTFQLATVGNSLATQTFRDNLSITSTYFMQFGLRYIFN